VDAVVFTAGIGENSPLVRRLALEGPEGLGIRLDPARNQATAQGIREIQSPEGAVKLLVAPTREENEIVGQVMSVLRTVDQANGR
jgi:acetate kinase